MAATLGIASLGTEVDLKGLDKGLDAAESKTNSRFSKIGAAVKSIGGAAILGGVGLLAGAIVGVGAAAFDVGSQTRDAVNNMRSQFGLAEEDAQRFGDVARDVWANNFGESIGDAANAIGLVNQQMADFGVTSNAEIKDATENAFRMRDAWGIEVPEGLDAATTLMDKFGLSQQEAFDLMASGLQNGLNRSGDFLETIGEYSVEFAAAGFSAEEMYQILADGAEGGVLGTDKVADSIKEMGIILNEGGDGVKEAFDTIGLSFDEIAGFVASGDEQWADYFPNIIEGLKSIEDPMERSKAEVAIFGTMAEDLGVGFTDAFSTSTETVNLFGEDVQIASMQFGTSMEDMAGAIDKVDAQYNSFPQVFEAGKRKILNAIAPIGDFMLGVANQHLPAVMGAVDRFSGKLATVIELLTAGDVRGALTEIFGAGVADAILNIAGGVQTLIGQLQSGDWSGAINTILGALESLGANLWGTLQPHLATLIGNVTTWFTSQDWGGMARQALAKLANGASDLWSLLQPAFLQMWSDLQSWFKSVDWAGLAQTVGEELMGAFSSVDWGAAGQAIMDGLSSGLESVGLGAVADRIGDFTGQIGDRLGEHGPAVRSALGTAWQFVKAIVSSAISVIGPAISSFISNARSALSSFAPALEAFKGLWAAIGPFLQAAGAILGGIILGIIGLVVGLINGIGQAIGPFIEMIAGIVSGLATALTGVIQIITGIFNLIIGLVTGNTEMIQGAFATMGTGVVNLVTGLASGVVSLVNGLVNTLVALVSGLVTGVITFFTNLYHQVVGGSIIPDMVNGVVTWITSLYSRFVSLINLLWTTVKSAFVAAVAAVLSTVIGWVTNVVSKATSLKSQFETKIAALWTAVKSKFTTSVSAVLGTITGWISDTIGKVTGLKTDFEGWIGDMWAAVETKFTTAKTTLTTAMTTIKDELLQVFENAWNAFTSIGDTLIQSIVDGIENAKGRLRSMLQGVAGLLPEWLKSFLGIASPSKPMFAIGVNLGQSLALGMGDQTGHLERAAEDLARASVPSSNLLMDLVAEMMRPGNLFAPAPAEKSFTNYGGMIVENPRDTDDLLDQFQRMTT